MMRKLAASMAVTALAVAFLLGVFHTGGDTPGATAQVDVILSIDADLSGTPCNPVDDSITIDPDVVSTHQVGLCIADHAVAPEAFDLTVLYDNGLNAGPNITCTAPCLESNPDANDGDSPGGTKLGSGWDCTGFGVSLPTGDGAAAGGDARITCNANVGAPDADLTASPGLMATLTFNVIGGGVDTVSFAAGSNVNGVIGAACGEAGTVCLDAVITKLGPTPTVTNTPLPTATPTATPTPCMVGEDPCTPTPTPKGGRVRTLTPTPTDTATPEPTAPPASPTSPPPADTPPPPPPATATPFGGPGGVVVPPQTGTGSDSGGSSLIWGLTIALSAAGLGGLGLALAGGAYRRWTRSRS